MLATMAIGLAASPAAAAASGSTQTAASAVAKPKPAVSVGTPKASPANYEGRCPAKVTFSSTVKVKTVASRTTVAYRWLRGDGSKSKVKTLVLRGKGAKSVTVKESSTFKGDVKGWQALQVLAPRAATSGKGRFSVSCGGGQDEGDGKQVIQVGVGARAWVDEGNCEAALIGKITASSPTWVHYRWVVNGDVVDRDSVRVESSRKVVHVIRPRHNLSGWAVLEIVDPVQNSSNRVGFRIRCKDETPKVTASVSAPDSYTGTCPVTRNFTGTIAVSHGHGTVKYRWIRDGVAGGWQDVSFDGRGYQSRTVTDSWTASASGTSKRAIELYNGSTTGTVEGKVTCQSVPTIKTWIVGGSVSAKQTAVNCPTSTVAGSGNISATGPVKVKYAWTVNNVVVDSGELDFAGAGTKTVSFTKESNGTSGGTAKLTIGGGAFESASYSASCPA
ncbi:hypothetical protein GCM10017600_50000 [Streptosporangium carneum]|uniref:Ig-like domain-containing protein n=2 Tax=Streptosporangium carneum TaxID=47481 RepID=A0A9W6MF80_9ACTN|nr:hypothetical protein GCM10017600_50000 [Streptosporangium carneum]